MRLISGWAAREGIKRLRLFAEPANDRSLRVAERSGFRRIGILADHGEVAGHAVDHVAFELITAEE